MITYFWYLCCNLPWLHIWVMNLLLMFWYHVPMIMVDMFWSRAGATTAWQNIPAEFCWGSKNPLYSDIFATPSLTWERSVQEKLLSPAPYHYTWDDSTHHGAEYSWPRTHNSDYLLCMIVMISHHWSSPASVHHIRAYNISITVNNIIEPGWHRL